MEKYYKKILAEGKLINYFYRRAVRILIFLIFLSLSIFQSSNAQEQWRVTSMQNNNYLPPYNLWLPGSYQKAINQNLPFITDSIFAWQYVHTPVLFTTDIFFIDSLYGWATYGLNGYAGGVMRTTNSGFNWDSTGLTPGGNCSGVYFIDRNTGWVVGSQSLIRKTTDGGINWINQDWPNQFWAVYYSVHFFNRDTGIITGVRYYSQGFIVRTTDGGDNWTQVYLSDTGGTYLYRQCWVNQNTGWIGGSFRLLNTTDRGLTFTNYVNKIPSINDTIGINDLMFVNENTGWICGAANGPKNLFKTTNSGENWFLQTNPVCEYYYRQLNGILFINPDTGWASSYIGLIIVTTNGGTNWVVDYSGEESNKFSSFSNSKIWCGGILKIYYNYLNKPIGITNNNENVPKDFSLEQNYPNPFNPSTFISYQLPVKSHVRLVMYNVLGKEIENLVDKEQNAGKYKLKWDASNLPSGVYFYQLKANNFIETRKMILIK